ncbi:MAG: NAD(P)-binding domain-containing protein [Candidatus Omnitrophica bacterium]|nr:NAD(P)-binding domain-containing protein [Candidatus Omnitrophota bacterium]MCM8823775.1 NAD(P)-binding domain-containing protein [Candidatus Omnitrophota bacterium]MCM8827464.1 NAD(P)-binding domain-containing protein [Candidatus Omnitrophota bacterium]
MNIFGFIIHPLNIDDVVNSCKIFRITPKWFLERSLKWSKPFKVCEAHLTPSIDEKIKGYFIGVPLLLRQMLSLDERLVLNKIISAVRIAESLGAKIVGLGGFASVVGDKGITIANRSRVPVTSGNTYTAYAVLKAVLDMTKVKGKNLKWSKVAIIGAGGSIGSLCARKLSFYASKIFLTARHREKLEKLKESILKLNSIEVIIEDDNNRAIRDADIVIITTSSPQAILNINDFKSGAIVCDVSLPKNIIGDIDSRKDVTFIEGGLIKIPFDIKYLGIGIGLPQNIMYACMAETILLCLEKRFEKFSLGDNINIEKLEEIGRISKRYGFEVMYQ